MNKIEIKNTFRQDKISKNNNKYAYIIIIFVKTKQGL